MTEHSRGYKYKDGLLMKLLGAADPCVYNQQHSWCLFSSLALSMAQRLAQDKPGVNIVFPLSVYLSVCLSKYMVWSPRTAASYCHTPEEGHRPKCCVYLLITSLVTS